MIEVDRDTMLNELAQAASHPLAVSHALMANFDSARAQLDTLTDEQLRTRYDQLHLLDSEGADYDIVFIGEEQHFQIG